MGFSMIHDIIVKPHGGRIDVAGARAIHRIHRHPASHNVHTIVGGLIAYGHLSLDYTGKAAVFYSRTKGPLIARSNNRRA